MVELLHVWLHICRLYGTTLKRNYSTSLKIQNLTKTPTYISWFCFDYRVLLYFLVCLSPRCSFYLSVCCFDASHYSNLTCLWACMLPSFAPMSSWQTSPRHGTGAELLLLLPSPIGGAMSGQDATLPRAKEDEAIYLPLGQKKSLAGKHWCVFVLFSRIGRLCRCLSELPSLTLPPLALQSVLAASAIASCEQMGGTVQANMSGLMVYIKKYYNFAPWYTLVQIKEMHLVPKDCGTKVNFNNDNSPSY